MKPEDLDELEARAGLTADAAREQAVTRRHQAGSRTARENIEDLVDEGSLVEYGRFAIAAQRGRREMQDLIEKTPADGLIAGTATVGGRACAVLSYDYTVLAGTQGHTGHRKKDRLFELIERMKLPTVFFAEGGGGRPGDTDHAVVSALDTRAFALWASLSGVVPRDRRRGRPVLRGQRGDSRMLGPDRRHPQQLPRHGRPGDDRGRWARKGPPGRGGTVAGPVRERGDRRPGRRRAGRGRRRFAAAQAAFGRLGTGRGE